MASAIRGFSVSRIICRFVCINIFPGPFSAGSGQICFMFIKSIPFFNLYNSCKNDTFVYHKAHGDVDHNVFICSLVVEKADLVQKRELDSNSVLAAFHFGYVFSHLSCVNVFAIFHIAILFNLNERSDSVKHATEFSFAII